MDFLMLSARSCTTFETLVRQRMENSSLQEGVNLKNPGKDLEKEVNDVKDLSPEPKDILEKHSGEPGEPGRIQSFGPLETNFVEMLVAEPESVPFPYADTKLRPEAPPFTPECVSPDPEVYCEPDTDSSCFVNVDLKLPAQEEELFPERIELISTIVEEPKKIREIKDARLKPFSIVSSPQLKKSVSDIEIPKAEDEEDPIVAVRPTISTASETREVAVTERVRILSPAFFVGNKTQIVVLIASIVVCVILVIFVVV